MFTFLRKNKLKPTIYCYENKLIINVKSIDFPIQLQQIESLFGKANRVITDDKYSFQKTYVWDTLGIKAMQSINSISLMIQYQHRNKLRVQPKQLFAGKLWIDGERFVLPTQKVESPFLQGLWRITRLQLPEDEQPFGLNISYNKYYNLPEDKYTIRPLNEPTLSFTDLNFKLCILQILMYEKELLHPKFDIYEFIKTYKKRKIDTEEERFEVIPEVMEYFKNLPIPQKYANEITEIYQDGGNEIYLNTCLECEGYEDYWNIASVEDAKQFPYLKKATLCYASQEMIDKFNAMGIEAKWI